MAQRCPGRLTLMGETGVAALGCKRGGMGTAEESKPDFVGCDHLSAKRSAANGAALAPSFAPGCPLP
jgi:hypothetical protein